MEKVFASKDLVSLIVSKLHSREWTKLRACNRLCNNAVNSVLLTRECEKLCLNCGQKPYRHVMENEKDEDVCYDRLCGLCLSTHDDWDEIWMLCENCFTVHLECNECHRYCNVVAIPSGCEDHQGRFKRKKLTRRVDCLECDEVMPVDDENYCEIMFYTGDLDLKFIDTKVFCNPIGCDGGICNYWVCRNMDCSSKRVMEFTDK